MSNYIDEYTEAIRNGSETVGKWVRLVYEYIQKGLSEGLFYFDEERAAKAVEYIETKCFHTEGHLAPGPLKLELWQKAMVSAIFGLVDADGYRQFREVVFVVGRKNGKSLLASAIAKYIFMEDGGYGARVYCIAPKLDQADIIYNDIWQMITLDEEWKQKVQGDPKKARHRMTDYYLEATNSTVKKIAFSAKKSDGFNPSLAITDEIASWEGDKGLKQYEVLKSGMGARQEPLMFSCSTSGYINDSIYDELMKRSTRFLLGDSKESRLLPFLYMVDDPDKWDDMEELKKANPNLGVSITESYLREEIAVAETSLSKKAEFLTKYCNIKQNSSLAWLESKVVENACGEPLKMEDFEDSYCVAGIDLSRTTDLSAAVIVIEKEGILNVFAHFWLPSARIQELQQADGVPYEAFIQRGFLTPSGDNFINYEDVYNWITETVEKHRLYILQIGYDRYNATYLTQALNTYGFHTDDVYQGDNLWPIIQEMEGLLKDGKIKIGDNDLLKSHLLNSAIKMSHERGRGRLVKLYPTAHIDGCASLLDALTVRAKHYADIGEQLKNED